MCEVLRSEFTTYFPRITESIQKAAFVAVDTEFTGLQLNILDKQSLFDSITERYSKLRSNAERFIICQIGISAFVKHQNENRYDAHTYNFYICPQSKGIMDSNFAWQVSGMEFLFDHEFDFNKFVSEGLPYMNHRQEAELRQQLKDNSFFSGIKRDIDGRTIQECCSKIAGWLSSLPECGDEITLKITRRVADYLVHKEARLRFSEIWTFQKAHNEIVVQKVSCEKRQELELIVDTLDERLIEDFLGFTNVFNVLVKHKKPLIGHNLLVDLMLMYNQFYKPLPKKCHEFKADILQLFPKIFDTKYISATLRKQYEAIGVLDSTALPDLFEAFSSCRFLQNSFHSPKICHAEGFAKYDNQRFHEAGFDAFVAGYVFLRIAHMHSMNLVQVQLQYAIQFHGLLRNMNPFRNKCNLIRANLNFFDLEELEPKANKPKWLVIKSKAGNTISASLITEMCSKFGSVDVKLMDNYALVSVTNFHRICRQSAHSNRKFTSCGA